LENELRYISISLFDPCVFSFKWEGFKNGRREEK
jgi:hypothetical protein